MDQETLLPEGKKHELYTSIYDDAMWLMNLTENLLSITRVENGSMKLQMEPQLLTEVFDEALRHVDRQVKDHVVHAEDVYKRQKQNGKRRHMLLKEQKGKR